MVHTPTVTVTDLAQQARRLSRPWTPGIVAELNGQHVKLALFRGEFDWHHHAAQDELFLVVEGVVHIDLREDSGSRRITLSKGQLATIPRGVEHRPWAESDAYVLLFEPAGTINTGNVRTERTVDRPEHLEP
ncbi:MAG: cupin domain-containing protein [Myxococcota bacterium]